MVIRTDGSRETHGKVSRVKLKKGDIVRLVTATGGGWGDPKRRSRERVKTDLRNGFITPETARDVFGYTS
jgi:N-methylhydantoinase B